MWLIICTGNSTHTHWQHLDVILLISRVDAHQLLGHTTATAVFPLTLVSSPEKQQFYHSPDRYIPATTPGLLLLSVQCLLHFRREI